MHQSRLQYLSLLAVSALLTASGCTPTSPKKAATGGECKVNADCSTNLCVKNRCATEINCSDAGNEILPKCTTIACKDDSSCPDHYYCGGRFCVAGTKPACASDAQCVQAGSKYCQKDEKNPEQNKCLDCRPATAATDCKAGEICSSKNKCQTQTKSCKGDSDCTGELKHCAKTGDKVCVACNEPKDCGNPNNFDCTTDRKCKPKDTMQPCTTDDNCSGTKPICDAGGTDLCVACDTSPSTQAKCPAGTVCDTEATSQSRGACVSPNCANNDSCTTGAPIGQTKWCDPSDSQCKNCTPGSEQCAPGTCNGSGFCVPAPNNGDCPDGPDDCNGAQACVGGKCSDTCQPNQDPEQCGHGNVCVRAEGQANGSCVMASSCTQGDNSTCKTGNAYNGLVCIGGGKCRNCSNDSQCANGAANNRTTCEDGFCVDTSSPDLRPLGAECTNASQCESGFCLTLAKGTGTYGSFCSSICSRTETTANSGAGLKDCPTAPAANVNTFRTTLDDLELNKGFRCTVFTETNVGVTANRFCFHATDYSKYFGIATAAGAFTVPGGGGVVGANVLSCQASTPEPAPTGNTCAYRCGASSDCPAGQACAERLGKEANSTQLVGVGTTTCVQRSTFGGPGDFCSRADQCNEQMCDGQCVRKRVERLDANGDKDACPCLPGDFEVQEANGCFCWRPTERSAPAFCNTDGDCDGSDRCFLSRCYDPAALTGELCQDKDGCSANTFPEEQFCGGRCAKHCNASDGCTDAKLVSIDATVCGYRPVAPAAQGVAGSAWGRVCRAKSEGVGTLVNGSPCTSDLQCKSEVCAGTSGSSKVCTELCGFANKCTDGKKCKLAFRPADPTAPAGAAFQTPVCL